MADARWRLRRQLGFLDWKIPNPRLDWIMLLIAWPVIPLAGIFYLPGPPEGNLQWQNPKPWLLTTGICLLVAQLWCWIAALRSLFGKRNRGLGRIMISRLLVPFYLFLLLLFAVSCPVYER